MEQHRLGDPPTSMRLVAVHDAALEVADRGAGEPVVFVQTGLIADELLPLSRAPALTAGYRTVLYHRRGYAGSSGVVGHRSIAGDAADCRALLAALGIERAHIVGLSYSGAVGLQLATDAPDCVHTLTLLEPPPVHTPSADEFRAANEQLMHTRRVQGSEVALEEFLTRITGPGWRHVVEADVAGAAAQMQRDAATFFDADLPALLDWRFGPDDARRVTCPVLHVGGTDSGRWFAEVRELVRSWLPHAEDVVISGADHSLALTHVPEIAEALGAFLRRHPL